MSVIPITTSLYVLINQSHAPPKVVPCNVEKTINLMALNEWNFQFLHSAFQKLLNEVSTRRKNVKPKTSALEEEKYCRF